MPNIPIGSQKSAELEVALSTAVAAARIPISPLLDFTHRASAETHELLTSECSRIVFTAAVL